MSIYVNTAGNIGRCVCVYAYNFKLQNLYILILYKLKLMQVYCSTEKYIHGCFIRSMLF